MPNKKRKRPAAASKRKAATRLHLFNAAADPPPRQRETRPPDPHAKYATASQVRLRYGGRSEMWLSRILKNDPDFPRFIKIGRFRFFDIAQLEACARPSQSRGVTAMSKVTPQLGEVHQTRRSLLASIWTTATT